METEQTKRLKVKISGELTGWGDISDMYRGYSGGKFGEKLTFRFMQERKIIGEWFVYLASQSTIAYTTDLRVADEFQGKKYAEEIVEFVLKYIYKKFKRREVRSIISKKPEWTENFPAIKNLLMKVGYEIDKISDDGQTFVLILKDENYEKFVKEGIKEKSRGELEKFWGEQIAVARKRDTER